MPSLFARPLIGLITLYRYTLSPLVGGHCRYLPTCSQYGLEAVRAHGAWAGSWMIAARLCRCRPGGGAGFDPVPRETRGRWWAPWEFGVWRFRATLPARGGSAMAEQSPGWGEPPTSDRSALDSNGRGSPHPDCCAVDLPLAGRVARKS